MGDIDISIFQAPPVGRASQVYCKALKVYTVVATLAVTFLLQGLIVSPADSRHVRKRYRHVRKRYRHVSQLFSLILRCQSLWCSQFALNQLFK